MRSSLITLASLGSVLAQNTSQTIQYQHLTGAADFLGTFQASLPTGYANLVVGLIPEVTKSITQFIPQATSIGDVQQLLNSPQLLVPALAYAAIPPNILDGPEYYVALNAAPEVVDIVRRDLSTFLDTLPRTLALTNLASYASRSSDAFGSAITSLVNTAIPQARSILTSLESRASAIALPQTSSCAASATSRSSSANSTSALVSSGLPRPTSTPIQTGAASSQGAGIGLLVQAAVVGGALVFTMFM